MKRASITEAKNTLSALLDRVKGGETILIEDRGVPIARLEPVAAPGRDAAEGRLARLERQGVIRRPTAPVPRQVLDKLLDARPPKPRGGVRASDVIIEERRTGR